MMSLQVHELTKSFSGSTAVKSVSFSVEKGQVVGLLGPNGAGKSTTLKMITGYWQPTQGTIKVGGYDVQKNPQQAKRSMGYLAEHNPLYVDMHVAEWLHFMGALRGLKRSHRLQRLPQVIADCGLAEVQQQPIRTLSKGYQQRVGLAQALLHNPEVLILDEPLVGFDPNQLREVRQLIKRVSRNKAVIFSTHLMQEVEALCDRVVIMHRGEVVAEDSLAQLVMHRGTRLLVSFGNQPSPAELRHLTGVYHVQAMPSGQYRLGTHQLAATQVALQHKAEALGWGLQECRLSRLTLEQIFHELTTQSD